MIDDIDFLRMAAPPTAVEYSQTFNSPGTWTKPSSVTQVFALVVGGGGGGGNTSSAIGNASAGGGGGGAVIGGVVTVTGPMPVTVGAGGLGGPPTGGAPGYDLNGQTGGSSYFGPAGPGPIPLIPSGTVAAGGGGGGGGATNTITALVNGQDAPSIGGGGGGAAQSPWQPSYNRCGRGGYGAPGMFHFNGSGHGGGAWRNIPNSGAGGPARYDGYRGGFGIVFRGVGYGGGGAAWLGSGPGIPSSPVHGGGVGTPGTANRGGGGGGAFFQSPTPSSQIPGGSGVVIVYWYE